jgi:hypothetical protein
MSQLKFGEGEYEVTMNMLPISDEEQQWNGDELSAVQLDQQWFDGDLGFKIHGITGTEGQYNGDFEGYTGY